VEDVLDGIEDNEIGRINTDSNWGNTIIIKHGEGLYSKLCHLRSGSFRVAKGEAVKKGDILAFCGNSGRSPQPHLHFQIQATPFIGSKTLDYPLSHYITRDNGNFSLHDYEKPELKDKISPVEKNDGLYKTFHLVPGQEFSFKTSNTADEVFTWEVLADFYNNTYIYCRKTRSRLYFRCDDDMLYFTHFEGKKRSLLYYFYLACYKVIFGYYQDLKIGDTLPANLLVRGPLLVLQDFIAPFHIFLKSTYNLFYKSHSDDMTQHQITLESEIKVKAAGITLKKMEFQIEVGNSRIQSLKVSRSGKSLTAWTTEKEQIH
jgi:hypothetical protein